MVPFSSVYSHIADAASQVCPMGMDVLLVGMARADLSYAQIFLYFQKLSSSK